MEASYDFLRQVLDAITDHIVVIDAAGDIQYANQSWSAFSHDNAATVTSTWRGVNYLAECDKAAVMGDSFGAEAGAGIRSVIEQHTDAFYFEYPCHSPEQKRWFMMRVSPFFLQDKGYFVIAHQDITERKLAEEMAISLARIDGLTQIPNRRAFDEFLQQEWKRCARLKKPISLAILDLDYFKLLNDRCGHQAGDESLIKVAQLLKKFASRPGDICARYGGEEFAIAWSDTSLERAKRLVARLLKEIAQLRIPNNDSSVESYLTASIGLAEMFPSRKTDESQLISNADKMLYLAKENGRNRCES